MIIDFVDIASPEMGEVEVIRAQGREPVTLNQSRANSARLMIDAIIERANTVGRQGVITLLRFHGHGLPGMMGISHSEDMSAFTTYSNVISLPVINAQANEFARLRPYFAAGARVEFHGCNVGSGAAGQALLQRLSALWGVPVSAGSRTQIGGGDASHTFRFEGPVYTANPNGRFTRNPNQRRR